MGSRPSDRLTVLKPAICRSQRHEPTLPGLDEPAKAGGVELQWDRRVAFEHEIGDETRGARPGRDPHGPLPAATNAPRIPGTAPISGRPSGVTGLAQVRIPSTGALAIAGT